MKTLNNFISESKEKPLYNEWDVKDYFNLCIDRWLGTIRNYNILNIDNCSCVNMCRQCEIALMLFDKFADDIKLHFCSAESEDDKKKYGSYWTEESNVYKAFKVIEQLVTVNVNEIKDVPGTPAVDIKAEIAELHDRFEALVKKCNDKWHKEYGKNTSNEDVSISCEIPCGCCSCAY